MSKRRLLAALGCVALLALGGYLGHRHLTTADEPPNEPVADGPAPPCDEEPETRDARYRRLVVGTWKDDYQGKRTKILREDGTGTMVVELSGMAATLFASRLEFQMVWSIEDGRLKKRTTGGEPAAKVKLVLSMYGDRADEPILELTDDRLLLLDQDGKRRYDWRRVR